MDLMTLKQEIKRWSEENKDLISISDVETLIRKVALHFYSEGCDEGERTALSKLYTAMCNYVKEGYRYDN